MANKISNLFFLILLFLLQSCSGGKIGNFLESSFNNNSYKKLQNDTNTQLEKSTISKEKELGNKEKITKIKPNDETIPLKIVNSSSIKINDANVIKKINYNYNPKSYRVFVILKSVDPSFPTENFSKVLRNGDINFEIEKIELMPELNQNKK